MGQTTDQIETDIRHTREDLRLNLQELEHKVKAVTDWRQHFQKHPGAMVAAAFGAGAILGTVGRRRNHGGGRVESSAAHQPGAAHQAAAAHQPGSSASRSGRRDELSDTLDNVKSALVGVAATQVTGFLGRLVPGFQEHLQKVESARAENRPVGTSH